MHGRSSIRRRASGFAVLAVLASLAFGASVARAAGPTIQATWPTNVGSSSATMRAEIKPEGASTVFHFEYVTEAAFLANGFAGASKLPSGSEPNIGTGIVPVLVTQPLGGLKSGTSYRFRVVAINSEGTSPGPPRVITTTEVGQPLQLPDGRGWEMVSPIEKNGGEIQAAGTIFGGGVLQAAAGGGAITFSSTYSFGAAQGSPGASQYVSRRASSSWGTENITAPAISGGYFESPTSGVPYQLFSTDLSSALLNNGRRCRTNTTSSCPVENPPLAGSGAPAGYRNYYRRDNGSGSFKAMLTSSDLGTLALGPEEFELAYAGATPDLSQVIFSTCAALTANAIEVPGSGGECDPEKQNLYEKSGAAPLRLINLLPLQSVGTPGALLAAQTRAISTDGSRVYWTQAGKLFLRDGETSSGVDGGLGGTPEFQTASLNGAIAFFTEKGHLFQYEAGGSVTDLTPSGGVEGVLGASDDGSYVYYATIAGLFLWHSGATSEAIAIEPAAGNYQPSAGTGFARVSGDGRHLVFVSSEVGLGNYDNRNAESGTPEQEVFLYNAPATGVGGGTVTCVSCRPSGERPLAGASIPGASFNGGGYNLPHSYKPRVLVGSSNRVFFSSSDALVAQDTNKDQDAYEWEAAGVGSCAKPSGCVNLISSGRSEGGASFVDASADGSDAYFLTDGSLILADPGAVDLYDARVGGGFPQPPSTIPCFGDACQPLPPEPEDPTPGTLRSTSRGNPAAATNGKTCKKGQVKKKNKCVKKKKHKKHKKHGKKGGHK